MVVSVPSSSHSYDCSLSPIFVQLSHHDYSSSYSAMALLLSLPFRLHCRFPLLLIFLCLCLLLLLGFLLFLMEWIERSNDDIAAIVDRGFGTLADAYSTIQYQP